MFRIGIFKIQKEDLIAIIGGISGLIGIFKYAIIFGGITIFCGIVAKFQKSKYWSTVIFLGIGVYVLHLMNKLWG